MTPRVSVVMAVYNGERYLRGAVDSILAQTLSDLEFIIVDDGSTDETARILDAYADPRIVRLRNETNIGLTRSLNRGLAAARGTYIARQDADDVSLRDRLARQAAFLEANSACGVVGSTTLWTDDEGSEIQLWRQPLDNDDLQHTLVRYCPLIHGSTMYRLSAAQEIGGYNEALRTGQDYDFWLRMSETWDMACLPEVLYHYRWHPAMASQARQPEQARNATAARREALRRRFQYGLHCVGVNVRTLPPRFRRMARQRLAGRYVAWSAGAREFSRPYAVAFLLFALLFDPALPALRYYVRGIAGRKWRSVVRAS